MATSRTKRWNGKLETLSAEFLQQVITQMDAYGDRVQFALSTPGANPNYQVQNSAHKKMAFDSGHHLLQPQATEFDGSNATPLLSLEQIRAAEVGLGRAAVAKQAKPPKPAKSSKRSAPAAPKAADLVDAAKYAFYKEHRQTLPASIGSYTSEISVLMRDGLSAEAAFAEIIKRYF